MGEVFAGRYELVDPIGRGGVGAVWRAWDHRRRRYVAAKVLLQSDAHSLLRFVREQALRIDHPHVLAPTSWAADDDKVLFTMDLVAGGSLVHLVGDYGPLPPAFVCTLLDQLLAGLAAVHAEGVVHRDVKPANVLLEATGTGRPRLRLSDFGIAMRLGEPRLTETNLVVGTPGYLAPEQLMGAEPDFPADLFAVGLVALYLLEGAKPDSKALIQYFAEHGTPGAPKGIPEPLWQVVATLLQPDPEARFRTATGARKALAAAAELLPEPGPDDELIEIFDQLGPLPKGFAPEGPLERARGLGPGEDDRTPSDPGRDGSSPSGSAADEDPLAASQRRAAASRQEAAAPQREPVAPGQEAAASRQEAAAPRRAAPAPAGTTYTGPRQRADASAQDNDRPDASTDSALPDPRRSPAAAPTPTPQPSMSDTGSFHLPPPQPTVTTSSPTPDVPHPAQGQLPDHQPRFSPYDPTHPRPAAQPLPPAYPSPHLPPAQPHGADAITASYTAHSPAAPQAPRVPQDTGGRQASRHRARRPARPGPPATVAVPLLLLALVCYAVGFWALTRI
ncbi:protein kinase domain-containing protein [Streptomyces sp. enrichment culture]|uniref:protein kinase domain-containing protein n=1 Tax=Streptomyces sp. enrichment culture TaxID=1795815 RepID=UPI003F568B58